MSTNEDRQGPLVEGRHRLGQVIFIMGAARSGSTLLGTLMGQASDVLFAGELTDWSGRGGRASIPRSVPFWEEVRTMVAVPPTAAGLKQVFDHPAGMAMPLQHSRLQADYDLLTRQVLEAAAEVGNSSTVVDSSHYPRRARAMRKLLGPERVRLVFMVRRPSSVARSLRATEPKGEFGIQLYLLAVGILAWLVYLTHPRTRRALVSYERLVEDPIGVASTALGDPLVDVDPSHLTASALFVGNRFARDSGEISVEKPPPRQPSVGDRLIDLLQWPLTLACLQAGRPARSSGTHPGRLDRSREGDEAQEKPDGAG